jgi:hypothetical protein
MNAVEVLKPDSTFGPAGATPIGRFDATERRRNGRERGS